MKKTKRIRKPDPVRIQINVKSRKPAPRGEIDDAIEHFVKTGRAPRGFKVSAVRWKNPKRKNPELAQWKEETDPAGIANARRTLRLPQLLRARPGFFRSGSGRNR